MQLIVTAKQVGRKHPLVEKRAIEIKDLGLQPTVSSLLNAVVTQQVLDYNGKSGEKSLLPVLDKNRIDDLAETGKVAFGVVYSEIKANPEQAMQTARQAFEDGMFAVFADDVQLTKLDETFSLNPGTVISFIRLTFLAGSYW